jgi:hypothetical protein
VFHSDLGGAHVYRLFTARDALPKPEKTLGNNLHVPILMLPHIILYLPLALVISPMTGAAR